MQSALKAIVGCIAVAFALTACGGNVATPSAPQATADTSAYRSIVVTGMQNLGNAANAESQSCTALNVPQCEADVVSLGHTAQTVLDDLSAVQVPTQYLKVDSLLRQSLALYVSGSQLEASGLSGNDPNTVQSGIDQINQATTLLGQAAAAAQAAPVA